MHGATQLESRVLEMMLSGEDSFVRTIRVQVEQGSVVNRTMTGYGFFTDFSIPEGCPILPGKPSFEINDVYGEMEGLSLGIGFILFIKQGRIKMLEAHTYDEGWPASPGHVKLTRL